MYGNHCIVYDWLALLFHAACWVLCLHTLLPTEGAWINYGKNFQVQVEPTLNSVGFVLMNALEWSDEIW